jgi:phosphate transport system protein
MDKHIDRHFDEALASLKEKILVMASKVEAMVSDCIIALSNRDTTLAKRIAERDSEVDSLEITIDELCTELLVRYQPAAADLRFITRGLKIVTDLERVGDMAVNMSSRILDLAKDGPLPIDIDKMSSFVRQMFRDSIDAFVNKDVAKAESVLSKDDAVDQMTRDFVNELMERSIRSPDRIRLFFPASSIVRYLERIADHSTNIAELAIFMVKGQDVRHGMT